MDMGVDVYIMPWIARLLNGEIGHGKGKMLSRGGVTKAESGLLRNETMYQWFTPCC